MVASGASPGVAASRVATGNRAPKARHAGIMNPASLKDYVRAQLTMLVDAEVTNPFSTNPERARILKSCIRESVARRTSSIPSDQLVDTLFDDIVGLGPLQVLMADTTVTDILVNRFDEIYVEREGQLRLMPEHFRDQAHLEQMIQKIVALVGREINLDRPLVDARMVDGPSLGDCWPVGVGDCQHHSALHACRQKLPANRRPVAI